MMMMSSMSMRRLAPLATGLAALAVLLVLVFSNGQAKASEFCGGQTVSPGNPCYGAARALSGDNGYGDSHSVCVGAGAIAGPCSSGPGQIATMNLGFTITAQPWIADNASGSTVVHGNTF
jgi:hypothetical protein